MMQTVKKRRVESRRRKALRRIGVLLVLMLLACMLGAYKPLPMQAVRWAEETYHTGKTSPVRWLLPPKELRLGPGLFCLSENRGAVILSCARFYPLHGWGDGSGSALDCSEDAPIHMGVWGTSRSRGDWQNGDGWRGMASYLFGRVDDPAVAAVSIRLCWQDWQAGDDVYRVAHTVLISGADWLEKDGARYFVCRCDADEKTFQETYDSPVYYFSDALDSEGRVLYTQSHNDTDRTWTSFG